MLEKVIASQQPKAKTLFAALIMLGSINCIAQPTDRQFDDPNHVKPTENYMIGLKAGANFSNVYSESGEGFKADTKIGLAAGGYISLPIVKYINIQPELLFSQKGFKGTGRLLGSTYELRRTTSYLDIPIFLAFTPIKSITFLVGPQYSYLLSQRDVFTNGTTSIAQEKEFSNDNIRRNTLCFVGGVDLNLKHIVLSGRGGWDVRANNGDGTSTTPKYKNMWLQTTIGYRF